MTASPAEPGVAGKAVDVRRLLVFAIASVLVATPLAGTTVPGAALAQSSVPSPNAPLRLTPLPREPAPAEPSGASTAPARPAAGGGPAADGIVVHSLGGVDVDAVGPLLPGQGGLPATVWQGSSRVLVADLLARVPGTIASPPLRDLVRRLLLTAAPAPQAMSQETATGGAILAARARLLVAMGALADADALIAAAGRRSLNDDLAWPSFESRLLTGDAAGACGIVRDVGAGLATTNWQKALIFCQLIADQTDQAQFGLNLLHEQGVAGDPLFFAVADALAASQTPKIADSLALAPVTPLDLSMLKLAWTALPARFVDISSPGVVAALARSPDLPEGERIAAAIRAEAAGALSAADLRGMFEAIKVTRQELAAALTIADSEAPARAVALLYLAARAQDVPAARAEVLQRLWELAAANGLTGTASRVVAPLLAEMPLLAEFSWFAGTATRIALFAGDLPRALGWYEVAANAATTDSVAAETATALWPLVRLALGDTRRLPAAPAQAEGAPPVAVVAGGRQPAPTTAVTVTRILPPRAEIALPWDRARLERWLAADRAHPGAPARAGRLLAMLSAVGDPVPEAAWHLTLPPVGVTLPAAVGGAAAYGLGIDRAAAAGRAGETILFAAAALAGRAAGTVDDATMHAIVGALTRTGQADTARAVALDAALSAGL